MTGPVTGSTDYDGRSFRSAATETATSAGVPVGRYHQKGDIVWAEFSGGAVVSGYLVGRQAGDGRLDLAYCQVLADRTVVSGRCVSTPEILPDGRIRLREDWERHGVGASRGVSYIEEIAEPEPSAGLVRRDLT
ncbi:hypothetical protein [Streptomyces sporangiiformans]|uniref:N-acetylglutamate synthase n=1 Tax=Streptomyces sporangiiformans TaxID=2315329 RepID=A0A505DJE9_9ACTN|nr:hypothetical protein [Streptomyces sporangiiformans]TPQ18609.1 hypothetical protein FGD71_030100 [Streptomyces sporangiiformans]